MAWYDLANALSAQETLQKTMFVNFCVIIGFQIVFGIYGDEEHAETNQYAMISTAVSICLFLLWRYTKPYFTDKLMDQAKKTAKNLGKDLDGVKKEKAGKKGKKRRKV